MNHTGIVTKVELTERGLRIVSDTASFSLVLTKEEIEKLPKITGKKIHATFNYGLTTSVSLVDTPEGQNPNIYEANDKKIAAILAHNRCN